MPEQPSFLTFDDDELTLISNLINDRVSEATVVGQQDTPVMKFYIALLEKIDTDLMNRGVIDLTPIDYC